MRITSYCRSNTKVKKRNDLMNASKNSNAKGSIYSITFFFLFIILLLLLFTEMMILMAAVVFFKKGQKIFPKKQNLI